MSTKGLYCFVCEIAVTNRYFSLATCRTQSSKKKLIEKLGCLVGDQYMIVITEDDVICRSCANLMNTLDRLEVEMGSVKRVVLRFLEKKYLLEEGELLNQKSDLTKNSETEKTPSPSFMVRKKQAEEEFENEVKFTFEDPRSRIWMQCDKCQYTTNYTSFIKNHIRDEVCLECESPMKNGVCPKGCDAKNKEVGSDKEEALKTQDSEPMELIVNNVNFVNGSSEETFSLLPETNIQGKLGVSFNVNESGELCLAEDKDEKGDKSALYLQVVEDEDEGEGEESGNMRNVLTVTKDGALEMRKVMWNEETNSPVAEIHF